MASTWGENIKLSIFGGSHTEAIGVVLDNLPPKEKIDVEKIRVQMARRAPGKDKTATTRLEADEPQVLSGLFNGVTTGAPLAAIIANTNTRSKDYSDLKIHPRPGHADYTASVRYNGANDPRGGGHFSGRITAPLVFAGAVCAQILKRRGITTGAHIRSLHGISDEAFDPMNVTAEQLEAVKSRSFPVLSDEAEEKMRAEILSAREQLNSVGGVIECAAVGMPAGVGSPMMDGLENVISRLVFAIPAVKGIEFGNGFGCADMFGSENNDEFALRDGKVVTLTNNHGGIIGGLTSGMPIIFRAAFKPTPSIGLPQRSVDLDSLEETRLEIRGRHDPCIAVRAVPCVEAAAAVTVLDMVLGK